MIDHPSVHERLTRLENAVQILEERDQANLRRIEQLASRMRELEQGQPSNDVADCSGDGKCGHRTCQP